MFKNKRLTELEAALAEMETRFAALQNQMIQLREDASGSIATSNRILVRAERALDGVEAKVSALVVGHLQQEVDARNHERCREVVQWMRPDMTNTDMALKVMEFVRGYNKEAKPKSRRKKP